MKIKAYVLNLSTRPDRLVGFKESIARYRYFEVVPIISNPDPISPVLGCLESHLKALLLGKASGDRAFAIFEDDARFDHNNTLKEYMKYIPKDWDIIVLGVNTTKTPIRVNDYCSKITFLGGSHALIIRNTARVVDSLIQTLACYDTFCDYGYSEAIVDNSLNCYLVHPFIVRSIPNDISSIRGGLIDDTETQHICESLILENLTIN